MFKTEHVSIEHRELPWDTAALGRRVVHLESVTVDPVDQALDDLASFVAACDAEGVYLLSCRLPHEHVATTMLLEEVGFRVIETVLEPYLNGLNTRSFAPSPLRIVAASQDDAWHAERIAANAFSDGRFHSDPRLPQTVADHRYAMWVQSALHHPQQHIDLAYAEDDVIAFILSERVGVDSVRWLLTAVAPEHQGQGRGRQAWNAMLHHHQAQGIQHVTTTISAHNVRVLNLYAQLGFRFARPRTTLHRIAQVA